MTTAKQCQDRREDIAAFILGELDPAAASQLDDHINGCQFCRKFRDSLVDQENTLRSTFDLIARDVDRIGQLVERFDEYPKQHEAQTASPRKRPVGGFRTTRPSLRILAAAAAIVIAFTGLASWLMPSRSTAGIAFADVLEQIRVFRPYSCLYTWEYKGKPPDSYRQMRLNPSRRREVRSDGTIVVFDLSQEPNKTLTMHPDRMSAVEETLLNTGPRQDPDYLRLLASMRDGSSENLGVIKVDGRLAHGFHRPDPVNDFTVWADPDTGLPIRIELVHPNLARRLVMSEFEFNVAFDESLFSTTAPQGYLVQKTELDGVNPTEQHLIEGLLAIATFLGDRFPASLERQTLEKTLERRISQIGSKDRMAGATYSVKPSPPEEETKALRLKTDRVLRYVNMLREFYKVSELTYAGEGVALGDGARPVLWWKPKATDTRRVVYGDLSIRDVSPQDPDFDRQQFAGGLEPNAADGGSATEDRRTDLPNTLRVEPLKDRVAQAEVILVATLLSHTPVQTKHPPPAVEAAVQFRVTRVLKGDFPNEVITFREMFAPADEEVSKDWILLLSPQCVAGEYPNYSRMSIEAEPEILAILAGESVAPQAR